MTDNPTARSFSLSRRDALIAAPAGIVGFSLAAAGVSADIPQLLGAFARTFNNNGALTDLGDRLDSGLTLQTCVGTFRSTVDGMARLDRALADVRKATGPIRMDQLDGKYILIGAHDLLWLASIDTAGQVAELPLRFRFSSGTRGKVRAIDMTGDVDAQLFRSATAVVQSQDEPGKAQAYYDEIAQAGGGLLFFAAGLHRVNLDMHSRLVSLAGAGAGATTLTPAASDTPILRATHASGSWDEVSIRDLALRGPTDLGTVGFEAGARPAKLNDSYAGRTSFRRVRFDQLDICISRPRGQIGLRVESCQFEHANYHFHSISTPDMHSGVVFVRNSHMQNARSAVFYIDSASLGSGQISFDDCLFEANPGFVFYCRALAGVEGVPGMTIRSCWNENNGTADQILIAGSLQRPVFGFFSNAAQIRFEDTAVGDLALANANVATRWCALDLLRSAIMDGQSSLVHEYARTFAGKDVPGLVTSLATVFQAPDGATSTFRLTARDDRASIGSGKLLMSEKYSNPVSLVGSSNRSTITKTVDHEAGRPVVQEISMVKGEELFPPPIAVPGATWLVWLHRVRVVDEGIIKVQVTGARGISQPVQLSGKTWTVLGGMIYLDEEAKDTSIRHVAEENATLQLSDTRMLAFREKQEALRYINAQA